MATIRFFLPPVSQTTVSSVPVLDTMGLHVAMTHHLHFRAKFPKLYQNYILESASDYSQTIVQIVLPPMCLLESDELKVGHLVNNSRDKEKYEDLSRLSAENR